MEDKYNMKQDPPMKKSLVPLPKWELILCFVIWLGHSIYSWYLVWIATDQFQHRLYSGFFEAGKFPLQYRKRDTSNFEWNSYYEHLPIELAGFVIHLISTKIVEQYFGNGKKMEIIMTMVWIGVLWLKLGWIGIVTTMVQAALMLMVARASKSKLAIWACACGLLATLATDKYPLKDDLDSRYRFVVYVAYKLLHFISFCTYHVDIQKGPSDGGKGQDQKCHDFLSSYFSLIRYTLYPPYSATLIVSYPDFMDQWSTRHSTKLDRRYLIKMAVRLIFWTILNDVLLHYIYNNAMMMDQYFLAEIDLFTLCSVGYTAGQYFHMKYVSIFGFNSFFALLDGMRPPKWPPICISRVALYSNMWRHFDRGLYGFLRDQIFIPIAQPSFTLFKRIFASFISFAFIWLWHGMSRAFLFWVSLNFVEVTLENIVKEIYSIPSIKTFVQSKFSLVNIRRIQAIMHIVCVALGIFSIFYFLGGEEVGHVFVKRVVIGDQWRIKPALLYLIGLGYFFAQVCMEVESFMK